MQGYGSKGGGLGGHIYPGSGATCDTKLMTPVLQRTEEIVLGSLAPGTPNHQTQEPEDSIPEDPEREFKTQDGSHPSANGPRIINVGIPGPGTNSSQGL